MRWGRRLLTCPRCDTTVRLASARFCNKCRVYLCPACSRKKRCPSKDPTHRVRSPSLPKAAWMGVLFAAMMLPIGGFIYSVDQANRAWAEIPVTPVSSLVPGTIAKVFGTLESADDPAIYWTGSSRSGHWVVRPFNVTDPTGTIRVDIYQINGEDSRRIVQSGVHGGQWRPGDPISVIGEVRRAASVYLFGTRVARSPTDFYRPEPEALVAFVGTGALGVGAAVAGFWSGARMRRLHSESSPSYPYRLIDWRVCMNCGDRVSTGETHCPACGASSLREPVRSPLLNRLPRLELESRFAGLSLAERVAGVIGALVAPLLLLALALWNALLLLPAIIFAGAFAAAFGMVFLKRTRVLLSGEIIEERSIRKGTSIATREVDRVVTVRQPTRVVHLLFNRGGLFVSVGPGLKPPELHAATQWVGDLADAAQIPHKEIEGLAPAMAIMYRDA